MLHLTRHAPWLTFGNCRPYSSKALRRDKLFSNTQSATFIAAAASSTSIPPLHGLPEVIVTGRANAGKSTLLNAVLGRTNLLHTSKQPGRTRTLNFYRVGADPGKLVVVDSPGYGARGRPEWGEMFDFYVQNRKELRRVYVVLNAKHGLNDIDRAMLSSLDAQCQAVAEGGGLGWTLQAIITKVDTIAQPNASRIIADIQKEIFEAAPMCLPAVVTAVLKAPQFGVREVRASIAEACGLIKKESKIVRT